MPDTIEGGAYLAADGQTWHDADGRPLTKEQVKAAQALLAQRQQARDDAETARLLLEGQRDPTTRAVVAVLGPRAAPPAPEPAPAKE